MPLKSNKEGHMIEQLSWYILFYASLTGAICLLPSLIREIRQRRAWHLLVALCCAPVLALLTTTVMIFILFVILDTGGSLLSQQSGWLLFYGILLTVSAFLAYCLGRYVLKNRLGGLPLKVTVLFVLYVCLETSYPLFLKDLRLLVQWLGE